MATKTLITGGDPDGRPSIPFKSQFGNEDYLVNHDAQQIGEVLIEQLDGFEHLRDRRIGYFWKREGGKRDGKPTLANAVKSPGIVRLLGELDWQIEIGADNCFALTNWQLEALVYEQLCRCGEEVKFIEVGEEMVEVRTLRKNPFDVDGVFDGELRRYGPWKADLKELGAAYDQAPLFDEEPTPMRRRAS